MSWFKNIKHFLTLPRDSVQTVKEWNSNKISCSAHILILTKGIIASVVIYFLIVYGVYSIHIPHNFYM